MKILLFVLQALLFVTCAHSADHEYLNTKSKKATATQQQEPWRQAFLAMFDDKTFYKKTLVPLFLSQGQEYELLYLTDHIKSSWGQSPIEELNLEDKKLWKEVLTFGTKHFPRKLEESELANRSIAQGLESLKRIRFQASRSNAPTGFVKPMLKKSRTNFDGMVTTNKSKWAPLFSTNAKLERHEINLKQWELESLKAKITEVQGIYKLELRNKDKHRLTGRQKKTLRELINKLNQAFRKVQSMEWHNRVNLVLEENTQEVAGLLVRMAEKVADKEKLKEVLKDILGKKCNHKKLTALFVKAILKDPKNGELLLASLRELPRKSR